MTRKEISERATRRAAQAAQERHLSLERKRLGFDPLEVAAARTRAAHEYEEAERFYVSAGLAQFEALLAVSAGG